MDPRKPIELRRSELYQRVWETPMVKLAPELGLSDVGLAKLCRRWDIPVPERGYWAKRQAGKPVSPQALPDPERDPTIALYRRPKEERSAAKASEAQLVGPRRPLPGGAVVVADRLEHPHKLVRALQRYVERLPDIVQRCEARGERRWTAPESSTPPPLVQGRYRFLATGLLHGTASLDSMGWVLRFHDALFRALGAAGARIERREGTLGDCRTPAQPPAIEIHLAGESTQIEFTEGSARVSIAAEELARRRALAPQAAATEARPSKRLTLKLRGTESVACAAWAGTQEELTACVEDIARDILALVLRQAKLRAERCVAEEEARRRAQARVEQLDKAFKVAEADRRTQELLAYLDRLDRHCARLREPYPARAKAWISAPQRELKERSPVLTMLAECLSGRFGGEEAPEWWPTDANWHRPEGKSALSCSCAPAIRFRSSGNWRRQWEFVC